MAGLVDNLGNVVHKSELSELILDLSNQQLNYGFLLLNGEPMEANLAYKDIYSTVKSARSKNCRRFLTLPNISPEKSR